MQHDNTGLHIGFTGTQVGMNVSQRDRVRKYLVEADAYAAKVGRLHFHHGDCVGADEQAHKIAKSIFTFERYICIHIHPPVDDKMRAYCKGHVVEPPKPFLVRNHDIVDQVSRLLVAPRQNKEVLRSGTWATKRYADKTGVEVVMVRP